MKVALTIMRTPGEVWPRGLKAAAHRAYREAEAILLCYPEQTAGTAVVEVKARKRRDP